MEMMVNLDDLDKIHMFHESDNCFNQYKCVKHFYHLQCIVNKFNKTSSMPMVLLNMVIVCRGVKNHSERFWLDLLIKGCVCYIFASLLCMPKREHILNKKKCFLFCFKNSFCS